MLDLTSATALCKGAPHDLPLQHQPSHSQHSDRLQIQVCGPSCLRSGFIQKYEKCLRLVLKHFPSLSAGGQRSCPVRAASQGIRDPSCPLGWESKRSGFPGTDASSEESHPITGLCFLCLCGPMPGLLRWCHKMDSRVLSTESGRREDSARLLTF